MEHNEIKILKMDSWFAEREKELAEVKKCEDEKIMNKHIEKYNKKIKAAIEEFYKDHGKDIQLLNDLFDRMNEPAIDLDAFKELKTSYAIIFNKCKDWGGNQVTGCLSETLILYRSDRMFGCANPFKNWSIDIHQKFLDHWNCPIFLGGGTLDFSSHMKKQTLHIEQLKKTHNLTVKVDQDYKGHHVWISIPLTVLQCHRWREMFKLEHLDAHSLHILRAK